MSDLHRRGLFGFLSAAALALMLPRQPMRLVNSFADYTPSAPRIAGPSAGLKVGDTITITWGGAPREVQKFVVTWDSSGHA